MYPSQFHQLLHRKALKISGASLQQHSCRLHRRQMPKELLKKLAADWILSVRKAKPNKSKKWTNWCKKATFSKRRSKIAPPWSTVSR